MFTKISNIEWINYIESNKDDIISFDYSTLRKDTPDGLIKGTANFKFSRKMLLEGLKNLKSYKKIINSSPGKYEFINDNISSDNTYKILYLQIHNVLARNKKTKLFSTETWKLLIISHDFLVNQYYTARERECLEMLLYDNPMLDKDCLIALFNSIKNSYDVRKNNITLEETIKKHLY